MTVSTYCLTFSKTTVAGKGALSTWGGSNKDGSRPRMGAVVVPVLLLLLLLLLLRTTGEGNGVRCGEVCCLFTAASSSAMAVMLWCLMSVAIVVGIVVLEVAINLARAGGACCARIFTNEASRGEGEEEAGMEAAGAFKGVIQTPVNSTGMINDKLIVVVGMLWLCPGALCGKHCEMGEARLTPS